MLVLKCLKLICALETAPAGSSQLAVSEPDLPASTWEATSASLVNSHHQPGVPATQDVTIARGGHHFVYLHRPGGNMEMGIIMDIYL